MNSKNVNLYLFMSLTGNAIFGFSFLFSKVAMNIADPLVLLSVRFLTAFLILNILRFTKLVPCNFKGKDIKPVILLGVFQPVLYFICESYGIKLTSSSFAGIIISLIPIAGIVLGAFILKEKPTLLQTIFSGISVAGVLVMTLTDSVTGFSWLGFVILLGAVFTGAMFSVQSRSVANQFSAFERTYVMFALGSIVFTCIAVFKTAGNAELWLIPLTNGRFWISIIYLSCISSVGAFMLLNKALDVLEVAQSLVFANVTTVISVVAGVVFLKENCQVHGTVLWKKSVQNSAG